MEIRIGIAETADRVMRGLPGDRFASATRTGDEQDQKDCRVTAAHKCSRLIGASRVVGSKASLRPTFSLQARSAESFCELSNSQTSFPPLSLTLARLLSSFVYPAWGFLSGFTYHWDNRRRVRHLDATERLKPVPLV